MKARIDKNGVLKILRANGEKDQMCPYSYYDGCIQCYCGDWCPLFNEPHKYKNMYYITICKNSLYFDEIIDERIENKYGENE